MGVDIKFAVTTALEYAKTLFGPVQELRLEEVEPAPKDSWYVTVSFKDRERVNLPLNLGSREFKQVEINSIGEPVAMRIRKGE